MKNILLGIILCGTAALFSIGCSNKQSGTPESGNAPTHATIANTADTDTSNYYKMGISESDLPTLKPVTVGSKAPEIKGLDQYGQEVTLSGMTAETPVVLVFYRGNWCPYCSQYLQSFVDSMAYIESKGARIMAVAPESTEQLRETSYQVGPEITLVRDSTGQIMAAYGVAFTVNEEYNKKFLDWKETSIAAINEQDTAVLPVPATYIIGRDGKVKWYHYDLDYKKRASIEDIAAAL